MAAGRARCAVLYGRLAGIVAGLLVVLCGQVVGAGVIVESTTTINAPGGAEHESNFGAYDAGGAEKLIILVGGGRDRNASLGIDGVAYGGVALELAAKVSSASTSLGGAAGVFHLDAPGAAGDIVVDWAGKAYAPRNSITVIELSGAATGHADTDSSGSSATVSVTPTVPGSIVFAVGKNSAAAETGPTPQAPLINLNGSRHGAGYQITDATATPTFATGDCTVAAVFDALPPPPAAGTILLCR